MENKNYPRNHEELLRQRFIKNCERIVDLLLEAFESGLFTKLNISIKEKEFEEIKKEESYSRNVNLTDIEEGACSILIKYQEGEISGYTRNEKYKPLN